LDFVTIRKRVKRDSRMQNWKCDELEKEESIRMDSKNAMR
jgi:hypothetical protein